MPRVKTIGTGPTKNLIARPVSVRISGSPGTALIVYFTNVLMKVKNSFWSTSPSPLASIVLNRPTHLFSPKDMMSFSARVEPAGSCAVFRFQVQGLSDRVSHLSLHKLQYGGNPIVFSYAPQPDNLVNGNWWITDRFGTYLDPQKILDRNTTYFVNFVIQDNDQAGYDQDPTSGVILDPLVLSKRIGSPWVSRIDRYPIWKYVRSNRGEGNRIYEQKIGVISLLFNSQGLPCETKCRRGAFGRSPRDDSLPNDSRSLPLAR